MILSFLILIIIKPYFQYTSFLRVFKELLPFSNYQMQSYNQSEIK